MEASLLPSKDIAALQDFADLAATRGKDGENQKLCAEFEVPIRGAWVVVLDGQGETLASFLADACGSGCNEASKGQFPNKVAEGIRRQLAQKESIQHLERTWRAKPEDLDALDALAKRHFAFFRIRGLERFCERERANEGLPERTREALRIYVFLARSHGWYALGGEGLNKSELLAQGARLLVELPGHPAADEVAQALFDAEAHGLVFDVPARIEGLAEKLRARAKDSAQADRVKEHAEGLLKRLGPWRKQVEAERDKHKPGEFQHAYQAALLGDAEATLQVFGQKEYQTTNYYSDLVREARQKFESAKTRR